MEESKASAEKSGVECGLSAEAFWVLHPVEAAGGRDCR